MKQRLAVERELRDGHVLVVETDMTGTKSKASDLITVLCSCGTTLTHSTLGSVRRALNLAERNHRLQCGWPDIAEWHGTPNGYNNQGCRCDPCTWAWASYQRGDDPVLAEPVWFDEWLETMAS